LIPDPVYFEEVVEEKSENCDESEESEDDEVAISGKKTKKSASHNVSAHSSFTRDNL
jgi:hypothetical protein